jgi:hypothetical protein
VSGMPLTCAQCGRDAPADPNDLAGWRNVGVAVAAGLDDTSASMVLCPECDAEDRRGEYEPGGED